MSASRDQRPLYSEMPAHLVPVYDRYGLGPSLLVKIVYEEAVSGSAGGGDRPSAELENDALSLASQIVANSLFALGALIGDVKGVSIARGLEFAIVDVAGRARFNRDLVAAAGEAKGATRQ